MSEISKIREKLKHGEQQTIAEATGYSHETVKKVLAGTRNNAVITQKAEEFVQIRKDFISRSLAELQKR